MVEHLAVAIAIALPALASSYVAEKAWRHRREWFKDPGGAKLPKVEVACLATVIATLVLVALALG